MHRTTSVRQSQQPVTASSSASDYTKLEIESFEGGKDLSETLTRAKVERLDNDPFGRTLKPVERVLKDTSMKEDIGDVVILGGSARFPNVQSLLKDYFDGILAEQYRHSIAPHNLARVTASLLHRFIH